MTEQQATEATDLESRLREALHGDPVAAENVLEILRPELADRDARTRYWQECRDNYAQENRRLILQRNALRSEVRAARKYADQLQDYCSPHAVAAQYANELIDAMDRAKEGLR